MESTRTFAVAGAKGGVGKTTTSLNLGAVLSEGGYTTAVVEFDLAMANLVDFLDVEGDIGDDRTLHDVLTGEGSVEDAVYQTAGGLDVVPSGTSLDGYADTDLDRIPGVIERLETEYDVLILDTPAGLSGETVRPAQVSDEVILVSTPRVASVRNVRNTKEIVERVDRDVFGLVLTKSGTGASPGAEQIADFLDLNLLGHVPEDDAIPFSQDQGKPVVEYAPRSAAGTAYRKIASKILDALPPETASTDARSEGNDFDAHSAYARAGDGPDAPGDSGAERTSVETSKSVTDDPQQRHGVESASESTGGDPVTGNSSEDELSDETDAETAERFPDSADASNGDIGSRSRSTRDSTDTVDTTAQGTETNSRSEPSTEADSTAAADETAPETDPDSGQQPDATPVEEGPGEPSGSASRSALADRLRSLLGL